MSDHQQVCVIPYRAGPEFCLITSTSGKWIFPKGNIDPGETPEQSALREVKEEAGLTGQLRGELGDYTYSKKGLFELNVLVFLMEVEETADVWEEQSWRKRVWASPTEAMEKLNNPFLREFVGEALTRLQP